MADPKYYMDDKAILDMMYQMVYGGQPTTSIERSYGGMKDIPKPPTPPDDSIIDEYMARKKLLDEAQARASIGGITLGADALGGSMARMSKTDDLRHIFTDEIENIAERGIPKNMSKADMKDHLHDQFIYEIMEQQARKPYPRSFRTSSTSNLKQQPSNIEFPYRQQEKLAERRSEIFGLTEPKLFRGPTEMEMSLEDAIFNQGFPSRYMKPVRDDLVDSIDYLKKPIPRDKTKHFAPLLEQKPTYNSADRMVSEFFAPAKETLGYVPFVGGVYEATTGMGDAYKVSNEMKELYEQMTPEQQAKVNTKLREQSVEKIDSAIDSYPGDF